MNTYSGLASDDIHPCLDTLSTDFRNEASKNLIGVSFHNGFFSLWVWPWGMNCLL